MTVGVVQAECVSCGEGFRFKRGKSGKTIRNMLAQVGHVPHTIRLDNKRVACTCENCWHQMDEVERADILNNYGSYKVKGT